MARITVEDCLDKVDNRFELVMVASKRARQIQIEGKDPMVSVDNDKPSVIALREIAEDLVDAKILVEKPSIDLEEALESGTAGDAKAEAGEDAKVEASEDTETETDQAEAPAAEDAAEEAGTEEDKTDA